MRLLFLMLASVTFIWGNCSRQFITQIEVNENPNYVPDSRFSSKYLMKIKLSDNSFWHVFAPDEFDLKEGCEVFFSTTWGNFSIETYDFDHQPFFPKRYFLYPIAAELTLLKIVKLSSSNCCLTDEYWVLSDHSKWKIPSHFRNHNDWFEGDLVLLSTIPGSSGDIKIYNLSRKWVKTYNSGRQEVSIPQKFVTPYFD